MLWCDLISGTEALSFAFSLGKDTVSEPPIPSVGIFPLPLGGLSLWSVFHRPSIDLDLEKFAAEVDKHGMILTLILFVPSRVLKWVHLGPMVGIIQRLTYLDSSPALLPGRCCRKY